MKLVADQDLAIGMFDLFEMKEDGTVEELVGVRAADDAEGWVEQARLNEDGSGYVIDKEREEIVIDRREGLKLSWKLRDQVFDIREVGEMPFIRRGGANMPWLNCYRGIITKMVRAVSKKLKSKWTREEAVVVKGKPCGVPLSEIFYLSELAPGVDPRD